MIAIAAGPSWRAYAGAAALAFRQSLAARGELVGRIGFYVLLLAIFSRLWAVALASQPLDGFAARDMLWYLAVTEWVVVGTPWAHLDVERDVRSGDLAYLLARPTDYVAMRAAEALGAMAARMLTLAPAGAIAATWLAGGLPTQPAMLLLAALAALLGAAVLALATVGIGLTAVVVTDVAPLYWIWQKATFVLGGLLLPITCYPDWLQAIARWTPFAGAVYRPARLVLGADAAAVGLALGGAAAWLLVAWFAVAGIGRLALRRLDAIGG